MNLVVKAPKWFSTKSELVAALKEIAAGTFDEQVAPELCQIPPHVAGLLAAELEAIS